MSTLTEKVAQMERALKNQYNVQRRIFGYLNSYARGDHLKQFSTVEPHGVLGQVYGDLASCFAELQSIAEEIQKEERDGKPLS